MRVDGMLSDISKAPKEFDRPGILKAVTTHIATDNQVRIPSMSRQQD